MHVDAVWQWSMRLWFLIIAREEADGQRLSGWERPENGVGWGGSRFTKNQWVLQSGFTFNPCGGRWPVFPHGDSFPLSPETPSTPWPPYVHTQNTRLLLWRWLCGSGMRRINLGQGDGPGSRGGLCGFVINPEGKSGVELGWFLTLKVEPIEGIDI